jgi:signal transduction histidine kinase
MTRPKATRRQATMVVLAVCVLVLSGLTWATWSAIELDRIRARDTWVQSVDESRALALSRLDALIAPVLYRESARPYNHFRRYYKPTGALRASDQSAIEEPIVLESPLKTLSPPPWVLLYFQATEAEGEPVWSSPQLEDKDEAAMSAALLPAEERDRLASPANWLAALRFKYTPSFLLNELEVAVSARNESRKLFSQIPGAGPGSGSEVSRRMDHTSTGTSPLGQMSRSATEFVRRGARLLQMEMENNIELCVPETVALENLDAGAVLKTPRNHGLNCVPVWLTGMTPLWVDLTKDGQRQLAFVRSVVVQGNEYCTLQGVLLDWRRLHEVLETEVRDLFPNAKLIPVRTDEPVRPGMTHSMMQTIPARLEAGEPAFKPKMGMSAGLKVGMAVAWVATVLALAAIAYGALKYVTLTERRMRFVAAVTHELRTPLTSFQLYTDLLADMPTEDPEQRQHHVETLRRESKRLARLVENVLAYSHIEDSKPSLRSRKTRPSDLLDTVRAAMAEQCTASGKDLVVETHYHDGLTIETDPEFVTQIMTNLVENACKYSAGASDPRIWLTAAETGDGTVSLEVDDAGPGVAAQDRRSIFEPFQRGGETGARQTGAMGLGLGLALSRYWAACLGGQLVLRRSPRGNGRYSCFSLSLPMSPPGRAKAGSR